MGKAMTDSTGKTKYTIVIIDDLPSNLLYFNNALTGFGYVAITAESGKKGLDKINTVLPDLILTDVNMPEMDGYELCETVKGNPATMDIPIILVTAQDDRDSLVRGLSIGADDFLIKPVNPSELQARVRNLLLVKDYRAHMKRYTAELETQVSIRTQELNQAFEQLKQVNLQLKESTLDTIRRLSTAAEYRDSDTGAHIWRMSQYSQVVARKMELSSDVVDNILYASPMHDVGKIAIPDHILLKPSKLTKEEWSVMEKHTLIGEQILSGSDQPLLAIAGEIASGHHERWDGGGYSRGLSGEDIPLTARVTTVTDVYDALTTKRVYKDAWTIDEAFEYIKKQSGSQFDPACADAFLKSRSEIVGIQQTSWRQDRLLT